MCGRQAGTLDLVFAITSKMDVFPQAAFLSAEMATMMWNMDE
jgi:hypothetical protein